MSARHPIIAVTGSSGAGTSTVKTTFEWIFRREKIDAAIVEGDAFHRFDRMQMRQQMKMQELQYLDQFNRYKAQLDSSTRIMVAEIGAKAQVDKVREAEEAANTEVAIVLGQA